MHLLLLAWFTAFLFFPVSLPINWCASSVSRIMQHALCSRSAASGNISHLLYNNYTGYLFLFKKHTVLPSLPFAILIVLCLLTFQNIYVYISPYALCAHLLKNFWKFLGKTLNLDIVFSLILLLLCGILYFHFLGVLLTLTYLRNDLKPIFKSLELHRWPNLCQTLFVSFLPCYLNIFVGFNLYLLIL